MPRFAQEGQEGEEREFLLELKLIADVGLVGLPNAGKSTLIMAISAARPKIADYPFTTLVPNLGVVQYGEAPPFVVADIPGLIEGAHLGTGLGTRFLRHIERTRILVHLVDVSRLSDDDPLQPYREVDNELNSYSQQIQTKAKIIVLNKVDMVSESEKLQKINEVYGRLGYPVFLVSALRKEGVKDLVRLLTQMLSETGEND